MLQIFYGILLPFFGTTLGAACVFFMKKTLDDMVQCALQGFAAGVMVAASVCGVLLLPAIEQSMSLGRFSFLPAFLGFWTGILSLLLLDQTVRRHACKKWGGHDFQKSASAGRG